MTVEELFTDVPLQVTTFGDSGSLPLVLRSTPPHVAARWRQAINEIEPHTGRAQPVHTFDDVTTGLSYAIWHHGRGTLAVISGRLDALLPYTDTTENERETLLLAAARHAANGCEVVALATIELATAATTPHEVTGRGPLTFAGCIALERTPSPKALAYARHARAQGLRLLYISQQPLAYAETIGRHHGLLGASIKDFDAHELLSAPSPVQAAALRSATVIGNISARNAPLVAGALSGLTAHLTSAARHLLAQ